MKLISLFSVILFISCVKKNEKKYDITLKTLETSYKNNYISLLKDTILHDNTFHQSYILKDNYNSYELNSYFNDKNIGYPGGKIDILKYSNSKNYSGFILNYMTKDYESYTFFEYDEKKLYATNFIESFNVDEKEGLPQKKSDTIIMIKSKHLKISANDFFKKYFIFDSMKSIEFNNNYLIRNEKWLNYPKSKQEEWVLNKILYKNE